MEEKSEGEDSGAGSGLAFLRENQEARVARASKGRLREDQVREETGPC